MNAQLIIKANEIDKEGRILLIHTEINNRDTIIVNIYAPTKCNITLQNNFLVNLNKIFKNYNDKPMIIGDDFNTNLNDDLDKREGIGTQPSSYRDNLIQFIDEFSLVDIWRLRDQDKSQFTWRGKSHSGIVESRLGFFIISVSLESEIESTTIKPGLGTDHSLISISLKLLERQERGNGSWKFNNILLKDKDYIKMVKDAIAHILSDNPFNNKSFLWEFTKSKIRTETMTYAGHKARCKNMREKEILNKLSKLEENFNLTNDQTMLREYENCKKECETIQTEETNGVILRSKALFTEEGEKNTKYFLNLEKQNYNNKHMKSVVDSKGTVINTPIIISEEQASFFEKLYTTNKCIEESKTLITEFLETDDIPKLNEEQNKFLNSSLTVMELSSALKEMSNDKFPGLDGFTTNFYKFFWIDIKIWYLKVLGIPYNMVN